MSKHRFDVGDHVEIFAKHDGYAYWLPGTVYRQHDNGGYLVQRRGDALEKMACIQLGWIGDFMLINEGINTAIRVPRGFESYAC